MEYIIVESSNTKAVNTIYTILKKCGWNMAKKWMFHWIPPYSKRAIRRDCQDKVVVLVWDEGCNAYTSTFQMYIKNRSSLYIRKVATLPCYEGKGIGKANMLFIEQYARDQGCDKLILDVYAKSVGAIAFYKKTGFVEIGVKRSIRFKELLMEKRFDS